MVARPPPHRREKREATERSTFLSGRARRVTRLPLDGGGEQGRQGAETG